MSSTTGVAKRVGNDAYYTPRPVARALVRELCRRYVPSPASWTFRDMNAGGGAFLDALVDVAGVPAQNVSGFDLDPRCAQPGRIEVADALSVQTVVDWNLGNPPFTDAAQHIGHAIGTSRLGAAFLLRAAFMEGDDRRAFWDSFPPTWIGFIRKRIGYDERYEDGSIGRLRKRDKAGELVLGKNGKTLVAGVDSCMYAWFVWSHLHVGPTTCDIIDLGASE